MKIRFEGLCLLLGSLLIGYWCLYEPLRDASAHLRSVSVSMKGVACLPLIIVFGFGLTLGGPAFGRALENSPSTPAWMGKLSVFGWTLVALSSAVGLALYFWLLYRLRLLGYPT